MKDMRKILALIIACAMVFGIASCSSTKSKKSSKDDKKTEEEEDEDEDDEDSGDEDSDDEDDEDDEDEDEDETEATTTTVETEETEETEETDETEETGSGNVSGGNLGEVDNDDFDKLVALTDAKIVEPSSYIDMASNSVALTDGIIFYAEGDEISDVIDQASIANSAIGSSPASQWDEEDVVSLIGFSKANADGALPTTESIIIMEYPDAKTANDAFKQITTSYTESGVDIADLNSDEYSDDGKSGYFIINLGAEEYAKLLVESMGSEATDEDIEMFMEILGDMKFVVGLYQSDNRIIESTYMAFGEGDSGFMTIPFIIDEGFDDPFTVKNSDAMMDALTALLGGAL